MKNLFVIICNIVMVIVTISCMNPVTPDANDAGSMIVSNVPACLENIPETGSDSRLVSSFRTYESRICTYHAWFIQANVATTVPIPDNINCFDYPGFSVTLQQDILEAGGPEGYTICQYTSNTPN